MQLFGSMFGAKKEADPALEYDADGNVIKTREMIAREQKELADRIARKTKTKWYQVNPIKKVRERVMRSTVRERRRMLQREETMKQDLERFLMQLEERNCWLAYELNGKQYCMKLGDLNIAETIPCGAMQVETTGGW